MGSENGHPLPVKLRRPASLDHLKKKQRPWQIVEVCLDMGMKRAYEDALLRFAEVERAIPKDATKAERERRLVDVRKEVDAAKEALSGKTVEMLFQGVGRIRREALEKANPPQAEDEQALEDAYQVAMSDYQAQVAVADKPQLVPRPQKERARYHAKGFSVALIAASCVDPKLSADEWRDLSEDWTDGELTSLFMVALRVNADSSLVSLGKSSTDSHGMTSSLKS